MIRVLIVGISGFTGQHLFLSLKNNSEYELFGTDRRSLNDQTKTIFEGRIELIKCNILNYGEIEKTLSDVQPDEIYFLAATLPKISIRTNDKLANYNTNIVGTVNFLSAVSKICPDARILMTGSSEEYGESLSSGIPVTESMPLLPINFYGLSKTISGISASYFQKARNLNIIMTRTFYLSGPLQSREFVISDFSYQVCRIEKAKENHQIFVGNLELERDFTDIRDVVRAYEHLMKQGKVGEAYNVCSGQPVKIKDILDTLIKSSTERNIDYVVLKSKYKSDQAPRIVGSNSLLRATTNWVPKYEIGQTIIDTLNCWRGIIDDELHPCVKQPLLKAGFTLAK